jgi:hypothetical protein
MLVACRTDALEVAISKCKLWRVLQVHPVMHHGRPRVHTMPAALLTSPVIPLKDLPALTLPLRCLIESPKANRRPARKPAHPVACLFLFVCINHRYPGGGAARPSGFHHETGSRPRLCKQSKRQSPLSSCPKQEVLHMAIWIFPTRLYYISTDELDISGHLLSDPRGSRSRRGKSAGTVCPSIPYPHRSAPTSSG